MTTLITSTSQYNARGKDFDAHYDETSRGAITELLVGHSVKKVAYDHLELDDGTVLRLFGNDGGCACSAGCYDLTELGETENIITSVEFEDRPGDDYSSLYEGYYKIFVFADNKKINLATFEGSDGNGYYGTGYHILVRRGNND